ncbi:MAG: hypothetical protein M0Z58_10520 [Nitrospiraceae bacterium]|nr:hypothetical protein [Nitrospiraceae bacterium]
MFSAQLRDIAEIIKDAKNADREFLRISIMAELDAISLYEQIAALTKDEAIRKVMLDVAGEEKTHVGEFQSLLLLRDGEQNEELKKGALEVEVITREGLTPGKK